MSPRTVGLLGFGEVGSLFYDALTKLGHRVKAWDTRFAVEGSAAWANLAAREGVPAAGDASALGDGCAVVISAVTAGNAELALASVRESLLPGTFYVDLNSVSPGCKQRMAGALDGSGALFVEAAVMSPIHPLGLAAPMLLAGPHAAAFSELGPELGLARLQVCSAKHGQAAATKMCRSVVIKGLEALVTESLLAARYYGVEADVLASLENLLPRPDWDEYARYLISRSLEHGARRAEEMHEVALTVAETGVEPLMSGACAMRQEWAGRFPGALASPGLGDVLAALRSLAGCDRPNLTEDPAQ